MPYSPSTIPEALLEAARRGEGSYTFHLEDGEVRLSCEELATRAEHGARRLIGLGVEPGDAVGVLGPNRPEWVVSAFAAWVAGAAVVPVQIPIRIRDPAAFAAQLASLVEAGGCRRVLADPRMTGLLPDAVAVPWDAESGASGERPVGPTPESTAVIQFTSGSTAAPKGARLSHAAVKAQIDVLDRAYLYDDGTPRGVLSWTPFFHDLGLFPNLVQVVFSGASTHHLPTERFARDPVEWLRLVDRTRAAVTVAPSSALGAAIRAVARRGERTDLSSLDVAYVTAEGADPQVSREMVELGRPLGFRPEALGAAYGLAEAGAVAFPEVGTGMGIDRVSLDELTTSGLAAPAATGPVRLVASCGPPLMDVRIADSGMILPDRHVGEIQVRGPAVMSGYEGSGTPDPVVDGWLHTGDLGYLADGELYVTGRSKDILIAMGHNYYPEDFEWAAARHPDVRPGRCVAFSKPGVLDEIVLLVEPRPGVDRGDLQRAVRSGVAKAVGIAPHEVVVLAPGTVEKTTSGKLRRSAMRDAYARGVYDDG